MAAVAPRKSDAGHDTYTFSSHPRTVPQRKKYRDNYELQNEFVPYGNIMYDRRIVRGNTYAQHTLPTTAQPDPIEIQRQQEARRRAAARRRARQQLKPRSPEPVEGRKHVDVQTELYLEELSDRIEEGDAETQTDAFLDRPPTPLFIPAKTGVDVATQIEEGDLFDFDIEVKPILEVLVGKTMEQALLEVMEEEELAALRQRQREFEQVRHAELVETQRREEKDRRHCEEKERRMAQQRQRVRDEKETQQKIAARAFAQSYLEDLVPSVFNTLDVHGYFFDPVDREVETSFMPWLLEKVEHSLNQTITSYAILDNIIRDVVRLRSFAYRHQAPLLWGDLEKESSSSAKTEEKTSAEAAKPKESDELAEPEKPVEPEKQAEPETTTEASVKTEESHESEAHAETKDDAESAVAATDLSTSATVATEEQKEAAEGEQKDTKEDEPAEEMKMDETKTETETEQKDTETAEDKKEDGQAEGQIEEEKDEATATEVTAEAETSKDASETVDGDEASAQD